jgi:hypothetical protein
MRPIRSVLRALFVVAFVLSFAVATAGRAVADPIDVTAPVVAPADPIVVIDTPVPTDPVVGGDVLQTPSSTSPDDPGFE